MDCWYALTGEINENKVAEAIIWINEQMSHQRVARLRFLITSTGGDLDCAIRLHDYLEALPVSLATIGVGQVDSAAVLVFLAGKERLAVRKCRFRIHEAIYDMGDPRAFLSRHKEAVSFLEEIDRRNTEILAKGTKKTPESIQEFKKRGGILGAVEAVAFGIATEVIDKLPYRGHI